MPINNNIELWVVSSVLVIVILVQSILFLRAALTEAKKVNIPKEKVSAGFRAAVITAIGPSMAPAIVSLALIALIGAPTTWMRLNAVGSAQTQLAMLTLASKAFGEDPQLAATSLKTFDYAVWGMALNSMGWMVVTLLLTSRMSKIVKQINIKYNPKWIKYLVSASALGVFAYLTSAQLVNAKFTNWYAALISAITMFFITKRFAKYKRVQELSLGISMLAGMFGATALAKIL